MECLHQALQRHLVPRFPRPCLRGGFDVILTYKKFILFGLSERTEDQLIENSATWRTLLR